MRQRLIRLAVQCGGDYNKMMAALKDKVPEDTGIPLYDAITIADDDYPSALLALKSPPLVLFYRGKRSLISQPKAAVIGSRQACEYGRMMTVRIVSQLRGRYVIVAGMAKGIDGIAHRAAAATIGVLGCGLNVCYPPENAGLYSYMASHQLLISEYPLNVRPQAVHFPFRNRIIAGLSDFVIVTQAKMRSGTMHTVNAALSLGKDVYTVPYRSDDADGAGCNSLISEGAGLLQWDSQQQRFVDFI